MSAVVLVGPPGAGKTTTGRLLAQRLGVGFADTDAVIEERAGTDIPTIFFDHGEEHFRGLERAAVADSLGPPGVLALGGGAVLAQETRDLLADEYVVYLSVGLAAAAPRVGMAGNRPLLIGSPRKQWAALAQAREPLYREVADLVVETDTRSPEEVAALIGAALDALGGTA